MRKVDLYAYQISGQTVGIDLISFDKTQLNGNTPFATYFSGSTVPSGYTNITSIENWNSFGFSVADDYGVARFAVKALVAEIGWTGLTHTEKDIAITYHCAPTSMDAIIHMMTEHGYPQATAQGYVITQWHTYYLQFIEACHSRWNEVMFLVPQFLSFDDAEDLFDTIDMLIGYYNNAARVGRNYGNSNDGIMDYVQSTNGFVGQGLKETNYTLLQGDWATMESKIKDILVDGHYR